MRPPTPIFFRFLRGPNLTRTQSISHTDPNNPPTPLFLSQYESVITRGNEAIVHHIEVFECSPDIRNVPGYSGSCDDKMKPDKLDSCRHVLAAWAMGAEV